MIFKTGESGVVVYDTTISDYPLQTDGVFVGFDVYNTKFRSEPTSVIGVGAIEGQTLEEVTSGVIEPIECHLKLVDSDTGFVYRTTTSNPVSGDYTFTGIMDRSLDGKTFDVLAKPLSSVYYRKVIEGVNPVEVYNLITPIISSVYYAKTARTSTFDIFFEPFSDLTDMQVSSSMSFTILTDRVRFTVNETTAGQYTRTFQITDKDLFSVVYTLNLVVINPVDGFYDFISNTENKYSPLDPLLVSGTEVRRNGAFIFDGNTKLRCDLSRFLPSTSGNSFTLSFDFCCYTIGTSTMFIPLFSTRGTATNNTNEFILYVNTTTDTTAKNRIGIRYGNIVLNNTVAATPALNPLTTHTITLVHDTIDGFIRVFLDTSQIYSVTPRHAIASDGFIIGGTDITNWVTSSNLNGYITGLRYESKPLASFVENAKIPELNSNFTLTAPSLVDDKNRQWTLNSGTVVGNYIDISSGTLANTNVYGENTFDTGDFTVELKCQFTSLSDRILVDNFVSEGNGWKIELVGGKVRFYNSSTYTLLYDVALTTGVDYTLTFSRVSGTMLISIDGAVVKTQSTFTFNDTNTKNNLQVQNISKFISLRVVKGAGYYGRL